MHLYYCYFKTSIIPWLDSGIYATQTVESAFRLSISLLFTRSERVTPIISDREHFNSILFIRGAR